MHRGVWGAVALAMIAGVAAGCTTSDSGDDPSSTISLAPGPIPSYEGRVLVGALPSQGEVPGATDRQQTCENGAPAECLRNESGVSVRFNLDDDDDALTDTADVAVRTFDDEAAATRSLESVRKDEFDLYDGSFDIAQDGATAGLRGEGSIDEISIDRWDGYVLTREMTLDFGDETRIRIRDTRVVLQGGPQRLDAFANAGEDSELDQDALARDLATEYIARLRE